MDEKPDTLPLEVSSSGKGKRIHSASRAIKVDLSLRKFSLLLTEENRPISGGLSAGPVNTLE